MSIFKRFTNFFSLTPIEFAAALMTVVAAMSLYQIKILSASNRQLTDQIQSATNEISLLQAQNKTNLQELQDLKNNTHELDLALKSFARQAEFCSTAQKNSERKL